MTNPANVLKKLHRLLKRNGKLLISAYNLKHFSVILPLLMQDRFTYGAAGILDFSNKKMFTGRELQNLLAAEGFRTESVLSLRTEEPDDSTNNLINLLTQISESKDKGQYLTYKYVVVAGKL